MSRSNRYQTKNDPYEGKGLKDEMPVEKGTEDPKAEAKKVFDAFRSQAVILTAQEKAMIEGAISNRERTA